MKYIFYRVWVDAILKVRENPLRKEDWKFIVQVLMGMALSINLIFIMTIFQRNIINNYFYTLNVDFFNNNKFNLLFDYFILYLSPSLFFNYFFVFYKEKYKNLIINEKYISNRNNIFLKYFFTSIFLPIVLLWLAILLR